MCLRSDTQFATSLSPRLRHLEDNGVQPVPALTLREQHCCLPSDDSITHGPHLAIFGSRPWSLAGSNSSLCVSFVSLCLVRISGYPATPSSQSSFESLPRGEFAADEVCIHSTVPYYSLFEGIVCVIHNRGTYRRSRR